MDGHHPSLLDPYKVREYWKATEMKQNIWVNILQGPSVTEKNPWLNLRVWYSPSWVHAIAQVPFSSPFLYVVQLI